MNDSQDTFTRRVFKRLENRPRRRLKSVQDMSDSELIAVLRLSGVRGALTDQRLADIASGKERE